LGVARDAGRVLRSVSDQTARGRQTLLRTVKSCGPDASTPASNCRMADRPNRARIGRWSGNDGDKKARSPGRARRKPLKPLRAGMPGDFRCDRCEYSCAYLLHHAHTRLRVHWAPGIPHALRAEGLASPRARCAARWRSLQICRADWSEA
jgi:hypothetical protein